jgi:hypothetical protein
VYDSLHTEQKNDLHIKKSGMQSGMQPKIKKVHKPASTTKNDPQTIKKAVCKRYAFCAPKNVK